ncbi:MAG: hypothetical protein IJF72_03120 [Clostridia bacterium]|nr:hypothetical protein [Clostridia bacterium]
MKDLLTLLNCDKDTIINILNTATQMRRLVTSINKKAPQLLGQTVVGMFEKECLSSNTLDLACKYLSGNYVSSHPDQNWLEMARAFDAMGANVVAVQNQNDSFLEALSQVSKASIINMGSKMYNPVRALTILMVLKNKLDGLQNICVGAIGNGDVNVMAELDYCLGLFGSNLVWYLPKDDISTPRRGVVLHDLKNVFSGADAILDLGLSPFAHAERYYGSNFGISKDYFDFARIDAPLIGSRNYVEKRGVIEYLHNTVNTEHSCYIAICMALLYIKTKTN